MISVYSPVITIDSGQARGYDNFAVAGKWSRLQATARVRLSGTTPLLHPSAAYIDAVTDLLDEIALTAVGNALLQQLPPGNAIRIAMPVIGLAVQCHRRGLSPNTARTGGGQNFLRPVGDAANALGTLQVAYGVATAAGFTPAMLAQSVNQATLAANIVLVVTGQQVTDWCTGNAPLPQEDTETFRLLLMALERWLPSGQGAATRIGFDPWNWLGGAARRHPKIGLFHELVHACANGLGRQVFNDDQQLNEHVTIGIPPFDQVPNGGGPRPYTENVYRAALGEPPRLVV